MTYASEVLADSPLAWWKLDEPEPSSVFADSSGNGRSGITNGGVFQQPGLVLDGGHAGLGTNTVASEGFGHVANASWMNLVSNFSVEVWVKPNVILSGGGGLVTRYDAANGGWMLWQQAGSGFGFDVQSGGTDYYYLSSSLTIGNTYHLVGTYDGTTVRLYINGTQAGTASLSRSTTTTTKDIQLGSWSGTLNYSQATLDHAAFYGTALSAARVAAHYTAGITVFAAEFAGWGIPV